MLIFLLNIFIFWDPYLPEAILLHHLFLDILIYQAADPIIVFLALPLDPFGIVSDLSQHSVVPGGLPLENHISQRC
jgi:hypothetical protein